MQQIPLSQGMFAIVDDADFQLLSEFRWCYRAERDGKQGYAVRHVKTDGKDRLLYLHRQLMQPEKGQTVIFLNHDSLDCRRENLRAVSIKEARHHQRVRSNSKSGIKGIRYNARAQTWTARMYRDGQLVTIGTFNWRQDAIDAYEKRMKSENRDLPKGPDRVELPPDEGVNRS